MRISHRDIKPENYIVAPHRLESGEMVQRLVTIDFGLGSFLKRGGQLYNSDAEEVVRMWMFCDCLFNSLFLANKGWNSQLQFASSD
jgi:serine/threonine protein kinase